MRYLLLLFADEKAGQAIPPDQMAAFMDQMFAYRDALAKAGAFVETAPLMPASEACVVRVEGGSVCVQDGPYVETREQLGGYYIIEAADMDEALKWAARCPAATWGAVEVRAIREIPGL